MAQEPSTSQQSVTNLIRAEAQRQGVDPDLAVKIATVESGLNPQAKNPKSTAAGLFQLLEGTRKQLGGDPNKRFDPLENARLGVRLIKQNQGQLMASLGRDPSSHELYMAHMFGPTGAVKLIQSDPNTPIQNAVMQFSKPKVADRIVRDNRLSGTVGDVVARFEQKFGKKAASQQKTAPANKKPAAPEGPIPFMTGFDFAELGPAYQAAFASVALADMDEDEKKTEEVAEPQVAEPSASRALAQLNMPNVYAFADGGDVSKEELVAPPVVVTPEKGKAKAMLDQLLEKRKQLTSTIPGMAADIGASIVNPAYGTAASAADFETARREGDVLGMGLAGIGMVPVFGGMVRGGGRLLQKIGEEGAESGGSRETMKSVLGDYPRRVKQVWADLTDEGVFSSPRYLKNRLEDAAKLDLLSEEQLKNAREAVSLFERKMIDEDTLNNVLTRNIFSPLTSVWTRFERTVGYIPTKLSKLAERRAKREQTRRQSAQAFDDMFRDESGLTIKEQLDQLNIWGPNPPKPPKSKE
jgi:hypothetical protein